MKYIFIPILIIFSTKLFAQKMDTNFNKEWTIIDSLIVKDNLTKTALTKVSSIYTKAKKEQLSQQVIKALIYKIELQGKIKEDNYNLHIDLLTKEISITNNKAAKSILWVLLAKQYDDYYQNNRWNINQRTQTLEKNKEDITTWSKDDFLTTILNCYQQALIQTTILQKTQLQDFDVLIMYGSEKKLRPTLYDVLAHEALKYYQQQDNDYYWRGNNEQKTISNPKALATETDFINANFTVDESLNKDAKALLLLQQILTFHKNDKSPECSIDANLERITWVYSKANFENKDLMFKAALEEIVAKYPTNKTATQAWYLLAKYYNDKALKYQPFTDTLNRFENNIAIKIINERLAINTDSCEGNNNLKALKQQILQKVIATKIESVNIPNQPFRMLVNYKNIEVLYYKIIKLNYKNNLEDNDEDFTDNRQWKQIIKQPFLKQVEQKLPATNDYQEHKTEIKIDGLPIGNYAIIGSSGKNFESKKDNIFIQKFSISALSYIKSNSDFFVIDRDNGNPISNASVNVYQKNWDQQKNKYNTSRLVTETSNANGFFSLKKQLKNNNYNIVIVLSKNNDTLTINNNNIYTESIAIDNRNNDEVEIHNAQAHFFTDRSIYRPSQSIFFKAIITTKEKGAINTKLYINTTPKIVVLYDVNNKPVDSVTLIQNEFGSINGQFKIPMNVLTGNFYIRINDIQGQTNISVEEYKRPKFYAAFEPQKNTFKLNDSITIIGNAKAYSGNNIDGATVNYTVTRNARFENHWMFWCMPQPSSASKQITNGSLKTDAAGNFKITFKALPDEGINKNTQPIFDYTITASVTDINGETREANSTISVGYQSTLLTISTPKKAGIEDFKSIIINAKNLAGATVPAYVNITITSLDLPKRLIRKRLWERPDVFVLTQEDFLKNFPYDEYNNETVIEEWKENSRNYQLQIANYELKQNEYKIPNTQFNKGFYKIVVTTIDKDAQIVKAIEIIELIDKKTAELAYPQYNVEQQIKIACNAGDTAAIGLQTSATDVYLIKNIAIINTQPLQEKIQNNYSYTTFNNQTVLKSKVTENEKFGLGIFYSFVKHNRFYSGGTNIEMIQPNKKLDITVGTFRNKILPGSKEIYNIKITGENGEKVAAELVTTMYDASLDLFKPHNWNNNNSINDNYVEEIANTFWQQYPDLKYSNTIYENQYFANYESAIEKYSRLKSFNIEEFADKNKMLNTKGITQKNMSYATPIAGAVMGLNAEVVLDEVLVKKTALKDEEILEKKPQSTIQSTTEIRKNFNETAFFFPNLYADTAGNYTFSFTMPEALTKWKCLAVAHTKDLKVGSSIEEVITQKTLMIQPNAPRFLREGDVMEFTTKIANTSNQELTGTATLELIDATTNTSVDGLFANVFPLQYFTVAANQSSVVKFPIQVPFNFAKPLTYRVIAKTTSDSKVMEATSASYSDGEENILPILTNQICLTESVPIYLKPNEVNKTIDLAPLFNNATSKNSETFTLEYTSNPIWNVVKALPYLMDYPYDCAEQTFNKLFANAMAASIVDKYPTIKKVFKNWQNDTSSIKSELQKNEELKSILLSETPWVLDAESEAQQLKKIAVFFDLINMQKNTQATIEKLKIKQLQSGGFTWFDGGRENIYITQYILTGIGKLIKLKLISSTDEKQLKSIATKALAYLDNLEELRFNEYKKMLKINKNSLPFMHQTDVQFWYMRSFYSNEPLTKILQEAQSLFIKNYSKNWVNESYYMQGMIAIALHRFYPANIISSKIINALKENTIEDTTKGVIHWKQNENSYYWYQNNFETHTLLIEAFNEITNDKNFIDKLKTWLLLNKQTNSWNSTISTAAACFAILNFGNNWVANQQNTEIKFGNKIIQSNENNEGYIKQKFEEKDLKTDVKSDVKNITIKNQTINQTNNNPSYGAVYYQYFADINDVKSSTKNAPLTLVKKLFIEKNNGIKKVLEPVKEFDELNIGDKLIVRIELRAERSMEFLHLKDMRASSTEPVNVLSGYKWQDGLGYYESTKDASTNFFIDNVQRGTYVFEYPLYITHSGNYSVGLASIQCMYAPEFISHSQGFKIRVK